MSNTTEAPKPRPSRASLYINIALVVGALATVAAWRHAHDPHRQWAKRLEETHQRFVDTALRRCFGGIEAADVRRVADGVRGGHVSRPFSECHRGPMAELLVAPNSFIESIQNPPLEVSRLPERERSALMRLTASARVLEQDVAHAAGHPTPEQREPLATHLEDLAVTVQHERQAFDDLVRAARDAASFP